MFTFHFFPLLILLVILFFSILYFKPQKQNASLENTHDDEGYDNIAPREHLYADPDDGMARTPEQNHDYRRDVYSETQTMSLPPRQNTDNRNSMRFTCKVCMDEDADQVNEKRIVFKTCLFQLPPSPPE